LEMILQHCIAISRITNTDGVRRRYFATYRLRTATCRLRSSKAFPIPGPCKLLIFKEWHPGA
jgi:hypothetical protein